MNSVKLTKYHVIENVKDKTPISISIQIVKGKSKTKEKNGGYKIIKCFYYSGKNLEIKEKNSISEIDNYDVIMKKIEILKLQNLKNNYYTNNLLGYWELEYDMFKIVGSYDSHIKVIQNLEEIMNFNNIINAFEKEI